MKIKGNELVEKRNVLNEVRKNNMCLQELRFFSIYLSKINARDISTCVVKFPLSDFQKIMDFGRLNTQQLQNSTNNLLRQIVNIPKKKGGYTAFTLFKKCEVFKDDYDEQWYIEISANEEALPLMFNFKDHYFTYELWNALRLKSANQLRMYEVLKQYEKAGKRELSIIEIKNFLGIGVDEYPRWSDFKTRVLDSCQEALAENTDISFTYKPIKVGRKFTRVHFFITKNKNFKDPLSLNDYLKTKDDNVIDISDKELTEIKTSVSTDIIKQTSLEEKKFTVDKDKVKKELSEAQENPLWWVAKMLTNKKKHIEFPERYALGILKNWSDSGYKTIEDLIANCIVTEADIKANKKKYVKDEYSEFVYNFKW